MTHDRSRRDLRDLILRRRAAFLSAALAGLGAAATVQACAPAHLPVPAPSPQPSSAPFPSAPATTAPPAPASTTCDCPAADAGIPNATPDAAEPESRPPRPDLLHPDAAPSICLSDIDIGAEPL